jgi:hypothetical protein
MFEFTVLLEGMLVADLSAARRRDEIARAMQQETDHSE